MELIVFAGDVGLVPAPGPLGGFGTPAISAAPATALAISVADSTYFEWSAEVCAEELEGLGGGGPGGEETIRRAPHLSTPAGNSWTGSTEGNIVQYRPG